MKVSRRAFLKTSAATLMGAGLPGYFSSIAIGKEKKSIKEFRFSASTARVNLGAGPDFVAWTYNGQVPGPEIRVKEGEIIRVVLKNYLSQGTTIHWHGIPIANAMDGVPGITQKIVKPGETFVYEFEAKPAGTFIYHSHAKYQLDQGLYGPLIIEPAKSEESYDREYSLTIYYLQFAGHSLTITHADGNPIKPIETDVLRIGMGERYDVMCTADNPGHWFLAASEEGFGEGQLRVPIRYQGVQQKEPTMPSFHPRLHMASYENFQALHPVEDRGTERPRSYEQILSGGMHSPLWSINNQVYPDADPLVVHNGERVRLDYWNHSMMPHPMHLHGHFFRVVNPALPRERWIQKDTLIIDPMQRIDVEFIADNPGKWFHHCHNLYHMEAGMANVVVYQG